MRALAKTLSILQTLECELHRPEIRLNSQRLESLLHPKFREFSQSGLVYTRSEIIKLLLTTETTLSVKVYAQNFYLEQLSKLTFLLTYQSAYVKPSGQLEQHANRSSIWRKESVGWQMIFHQGTPTDAFTPGEL